MSDQTETTQSDLDLHSFGLSSALKPLDVDIIKDKGTSVLLSQTAPCR